MAESCTAVMDKRVKELWVKALRSGEYQQGRGLLRTPEGNYCCLGVLCDLHANETGGAWNVGTDGEARYDGECGVLPFSVSKWAGLTDGESFLDDPKLHKEQISALNDAGCSFATLAYEIEKYL